MIESSPNVYCVRHARRVAGAGRPRSATSSTPSPRSSPPRSRAGSTDGGEPSPTPGADDRVARVALAETWAAGAVGFVRGAGEWWLAATATARRSPDREELTAQVAAWLWAGPVGVLARDRTAAPTTRGVPTAPPTHPHPLDPPSPRHPTRRRPPPRRRRRRRRRRAPEQVLLGHWPELRLAARKLMLDPRLHRIEGQSMAEHRERVLEQLRMLARRGRRRSARSRARSAAPTTTAAAWPGSRSSSSPTRRCRSSRACSGACSPRRSSTWAPSDHHDRFLPGAMSVKVPGAFAMTETGHGSDVAAHRHHRDVRPGDAGVRPPHPVPRRRGRTTSATRPCTARRRSCSPSSSRTASTTACTRSTSRSATPATMEFLPGVGGEDDGLKGGLNGIDNGRLQFDARARPAPEPARPVRPRRRGRHLHARRSPAPAAASSRCSAPWCRGACRSTARRSTPASSVWPSR